MKKLAFAAMIAAVLGLFALGSAGAEDFQVRMLNRGAQGAMVFEPAFLQIDPGDSVTFLPTNPGHNAETIPGMLPRGASAFRGAISQAVTVTFAHAGVYGVRCSPHYVAGQVALIEVGDGAAVNGAEASAVRHPGLARTRMSALFAQMGDAN